MIGEPNEEAFPESQVQITSGYEHVRTIDPSTLQVLAEILAELKKISTQLSFMTEQEFQ